MAKNNISGFGLSVHLVASVTFPAGITITSFADDADPFDTPSVKQAETAMGLNGDLITWSKAVPLTSVINVIPDSDDDVNLAVLADANRVGKGKTVAKDVITLTATYPSGKTLTLSGGVLTDAPPGAGVASAGRLKSHAYGFTFEALNRAAGAI